MLSGMPLGRDRPSSAAVQRVVAAEGALGRAAVAQLDASCPWFPGLPAEQRSRVGLVAQNGIRAFIGRLGTGLESPDAFGELFGTASHELARSMSLAQTLDLVRTVAGVVERDLVAMVPAEERPFVREVALRYSREIAFGAAQAYADAAEARGSWDARLEALVVDAVLRGEADESLQSRVAALGWGSVTRVCVLVAAPTHPRQDSVSPVIHDEASRMGAKVLIATSGSQLVAVLGEVEDPLAVAAGILPFLGEGPVVVGPVVPHLFAAGRSARAALSGYAAAPARAGCPRPVHAEDLLPERALLGDHPARNALVTRVFRPLQEKSGGTLLDTATAYLDATAGIEGTARTLIVHANTIRYRLRSIHSLIGFDLTDPHDAFTVRIALALGRAAGPVGRSGPGPRRGQRDPRPARPAGGASHDPRGLWEPDKSSG